MDKKSFPWSRPNRHQRTYTATVYLVKRVGTRSPPGEEQTETHGLEHTADGTDSNGVQGSLLGEDLGDELYGFNVS